MRITCRAGTRSPWVPARLLYMKELLLALAVATLLRAIPTGSMHRLAKPSHASPPRQVKLRSPTPFPLRDLGDAGLLPRPLRGASPGSSHRRTALLAVSSALPALSRTAGGWLRLPEPRDGLRSLTPLRFALMTRDSLGIANHPAHFRAYCLHSPSKARLLNHD